MQQSVRAAWLSALGLDDHDRRLMADALYLAYYESSERAQRGAVSGDYSGVPSREADRKRLLRMADALSADL